MKLKSLQVVALAAIGFVPGLSAAEPTAVLQNPPMSYQTERGTFAPNILRRRTADGELKMKVVANPDLPQPSKNQPLEFIFDGNTGYMARWEFPPENGESFNTSFTLDLGESYSLGKAVLFWPAEAWMPKTWTLSVSKDGENFEPVAENKTDVSNKRNPTIELPGVPARFVRLTMSGASTPDQNNISLEEMQLFVSEIASPPTALDGYSLCLLPGVQFKAPPSMWRSQWPVFKGRNRLQANPDCKGDASFVVTLPEAQKLSYLHFGFYGPGGGTWENGVVVETAEEEKGPWTTAFKTEKPFKASTVPVPDDLPPARFIRVTNPAKGDKGPSGTNLSLFEVFGPMGSSAPTQAFASVPAQKGKRISAGVFDAKGNLVRTLFDYQQTNEKNANLFWDGHDEFGQRLPDGTYEWRLIFTGATAKNTGSVGDSGTPPYDENEALGGMTSVAYDAKGNLYQAGWWVEQHTEMRKSAPDASTLWVQKMVGAIALAVDEGSVFVSVSPYRVKEDRIYRFSAKDGKPLPFGEKQDYIVVNTGRPEKRDEAASNSMEGKFLFEPLNGLGLDGKRLWVSNYLTNQVEIFDRASGKKIESLPVDKPLGLAVSERQDGSGLVWVVSGKKIRVFSFTAEGRVREESGLGFKAGPSPMNISVRADGKKLAVGDTVDGVIRSYEIDSKGKAAATGEFGGKAKPGPIQEARFRSGGLWGITLAPDGGLAVADGGNRSVWIFDAAGKLTRREFSEFQPAPFVYDAEKETHHLLSGPWDYRVDLAGGHQGDPLWHGDGTWTLYANWIPEDQRFFGDKSIIRTLPNGRKYLFYLWTRESRGPAIYALSDATIRRSVVIGTYWGGLNGTEKPTPALWTWRDTNGNGQMDAEPGNPNGGGEYARYEPEKKEPYETRAPGVWVDEKGDIWFAKVNNQIVKLPLLGFDEAGNPKYDFAQREVVVAREGSKEQYAANNLKTSPLGDIFALGFSKITGGDPFLWMGGKEVRQYSAAGELKRRFRVPRGGTIVTFDFDRINPEILYTTRNIGSDHEVSAWSPDGLCLASVVPDHALVGNTGWVDHFMGLCAFSPDGVRRMVYAEDVLNGKSIRYTFENFDDIQRLKGSVVLQGGATSE